MQFSDRWKDKDTKKFFENRNLKNLKKRTVDYLGGLWGGDAYRGPDLFLAHTGAKKLSKQLARWLEGHE